MAPKQNLAQTLEGEKAPGGGGGVWGLLWSSAVLIHPCPSPLLDATGPDARPCGLGCAPSVRPSRVCSAASAVVSHPLLNADGGGGGDEMRRRIHGMAGDRRTGRPAASDTTVGGGALSC